MGHNNIFSQLELMQARLKSIPDGWSFNYVGKAFAIRNNLRKPISEEERAKNPGCYPYYGPTKIQGYIGSYEQDGCFALIGEDGDHFLKYNEQSMTQLVDGKCTINNHAHIIEGTKTATREWFYYYFMHRDIFSFLSRQGAGRYKLNKASLEKIPVLIPPVIEQNKIAQILSTWDQAISTTEQLLTNSQQQKKALMQQLLTGKKRLLDKNGVRFSGEWKSCTINKLLLISKGQQLNKDTLSNAEKYPVINGGVEPSGYTDKYNAEANTITISEGGNSCGYVSFQLSRFWCGGHCYAITNSKLDLYFTYQTLKFNQIKIMQLRVGSGLPNIQKKHLDAFPISFPVDVEEQQKIALVLTAADQEIAILQRKLDCLKQEKKALMQALLTGNRRVVLEAAHV